MNVKETMVSDVVQDFISSHVGDLFPGCIVGCANSHKQFVYAAGTHEGVTPITTNDWFDIASVTKALLNTVVLKYFTAKELDDKIIDFVPMKGKHRELITVRHLLTFGVEYGELPRLSQVPSKEALIDIIQNGDLPFVPGLSYRYTNISSMLLSMYLERKWGNRFDKLLSGMLLERLGMRDTFFPKPFHQGISRFVTTEYHLDRGIVQDESAQLFKTPTGSAGLFSTIEDLLMFGRSFLGNNPFLRTEMVKEMSRSQFGDAAMTFGLGMGLRHHNECDLRNSENVPMVVLKKNGFSGVHFSVMPEDDFCFVVFGNICFPQRPDADKRDEFTRFHKKLLRLLYENREKLL